MNTYIYFVLDLPIVNSFFLSTLLISLPTCLLFTFGLIKGIYAEIWKPFRLWFMAIFMKFITRAKDSSLYPTRW